MVDRSEYVIDQSIAEGMEILLADVIRKYPIIYDRSSKQKNESSFQEKYDNAWNKISDELNLELDSCKSLWSCMKQKFIKHRKRLDNGETVSAWPTFNILHTWLDKHVKKRKSRHDYIKQMKLITKTKSELNEEDESNEPDDAAEWSEIVEDKNTATVQVKLKRKANHLMTDDKSGINRFESKTKKFNIEVVNEIDGTTVFEERDLFSELSSGQKPLERSNIKEAEIVVLEDNRSKQCTPQIEIIDVKESIKPNDTDKNYLKIERCLSNFAQTLERLNIEKTLSYDSNEAFGKYIGSIVRELPAHKRMKIRLKILQYASELIANESSN